MEKTEKSLRHQFIVVEGVIGVGKTSLATMLAERFKAKLVEERHEENPFLVDFYRDPKRFAFQTEVFFLLSRYKQQEEDFAQVDLFEQRIVADYHFLKNRIFSSLTLEDREYQLYDRIASVLENHIIKPDLLIYLKSTLDRLMYNIRLRNRSYEKDMDPDYISKLIQSYNRFISTYNASDLLVINSTKLDFVRHPEQFEAIVDRILHAEKGTTLYDPDIP